MLCLLLVVLSSLMEARADSPPLEGPSEIVEVDRVQIDVSVIDPNGDSWASVPSLPRDAFIVRLDGRPLEGSVLERTEFDEICPSGEPVGGVLAAAEIPTIIVLVDLNYLDIPMRNRVRIALEALAETAEVTPLRVKVLLYANRLLPITAGFVSKPAEIRHAAAAISGSRAVGPPIEGILEQVTATIEAGATLGRLNVQQFSGSSGAGNALAIGDAVTERTLEAFAGTTRQASALAELAQSSIDPRPSLQAIESVLLSHASIPTRKALVLFTSGLFDMPEELWPNEVADRSRIIQSGFTMWSVDARGSGLFDDGIASRLLGHLASQTGGTTLRGAGRLSIAFDRALSELSCYYLISIPLEGPKKGRRHVSIDVRLDTEKFPALWRYRVRAATGIVLENPEKRRENRRLAGLIAPDGFSFPEVRITAAYPDGRERFDAPIEISILLSDLTFFKRSPQDVFFSAEFGWEGVVSSARGRTVCVLGDRRRRVIRVKRAPERHPPAQLVLRSICSLPGPGTFDIRVVVEDLASGDIGAASAFLEIPDPDLDEPSITALRLGRNSGRDFLLDTAAEVSISVPRDVERVGYTPLRPGEPVTPHNRLILRFVACHWDPPPRIVLYRRNTERSAAAAPAPLFQLIASRRGAIFEDDRACREYEAVVPENTLGPGRYGLAFVDRNVAVTSRDDLGNLIRDLHIAPFIEFLVATPPERTRDPGEVQVSSLSGVPSSRAPLSPRCLDGR